MMSDLLIRMVDWTKRINTVASLNADSKKAGELQLSAHEIRYATRAVQHMESILMGMSTDAFDESKATTITMLAKEGQRLFEDLIKAGEYKSARAVNAALTELTQVS